MPTLKTVAPKAANTFDFSGIETYPYDEDYEYISLGFNIKMVGGTHEVASIYVNGAHGGDTHGINSSTYRAIYLPKHYTELGGDLSNAVITAKAYVGGGSSKVVPITISEAYIIRDYVEPKLYEITPENLFVNGYSKIKFRGSKHSTGMAGSINGGKSFEVKAIPGTIVIDPTGYNTRGEILVPPGCFVEGVNKGSVRGLNHTKTQAEGWDTTYGTATIIPTTVSNIEFSDPKPINSKPLTVSWEASPQQLKRQIRYTAKGGAMTTLEIEDTTEKFYLFPPGALGDGKIEVGIRIFDGVFWSAWTDKEITMDTNLIYIEPNKIAQNKDKPIIVMWNTSDIQTQFKLTYSGTASEEVTGTTAKTHTFPAGTFGNGNVTLTLQVFNGYVWTEKTASFMAYGAPPNPTLTTSTTYATAIPNFTWTATEQVSYRIQVLKESTMVLDSGEVYSSNKNHQFTNVLENNTAYTVRLRVRNQYEIESEWGFKSFSVAFTELQKPNFDMFSNDNLGTIMFNIYNAIGQVDFSYCEILRREYGEVTWNKIATDLPLTATYTDYTCRSGVLYEYKVRAIGTSGGYIDSEIGLKEISLRNTMLSDTANFNNYVVLIHNPKKNRVFTKETYAMQYSGLKSPSFEFGEVKYTSMNTSFTVDEKTLDKLLDLYYSNNILLFRDNRGKKIYGQISGEPSAADAELMKYTVSFNFAETNYIEGVLV